MYWEGVLWKDESRKEEDMEEVFGEGVCLRWLDENTNGTEIS